MQLMDSSFVQPDKVRDLINKHCINPKTRFIDPFFRYGPVFAILFQTESIRNRFRRQRRSINHGPGFSVRPLPLQAMHADP